ncbi:rhodanese-like domain-containing protein [Oceanibacterium hippocampi]|uniref:Molybdopterin biosynthesis protein MoeB n=1 Tax=Oceanibacterium hippocampi TaxID=745714 RepID=A0A1Y5RSG2_9PROT|nr:rhodanese-like domain-containing protein [Oceanibacterium hippocampi]SLN21657.1 molybdopterin biosynthesis protein MoeB [Oceanibacterium hippocampi]
MARGHDGADAVAYAGDVSPRDAWEMLKGDDRATLVDVRTDAEWSFVGIADLSGLPNRATHISWKLFPSMSPNGRFVDEVSKLVAERDAPILFLCRSGARSRDAAIEMTAAGYRRCYNIAEGFEGDRDARGHRGTVNGWKVAGLPWTQG